MAAIRDGEELEAAVGAENLTPASPDEMKLIAIFPLTEGGQTARVFLASHGNGLNESNYWPRPLT